MGKHLVFVYGTLRRGGVRAMPELFPGSKFVGVASVGGRLYDFGSYPGLTLGESGSPVAGEVYEVSEEVLKKLDDIEAPAFYSRREVEVSLGGGVLGLRARPESLPEPHADYVGRLDRVCRDENRVARRLLK